MIDSLGAYLIERSRYSQLSELLDSTSSFCGPFSHPFLDREGKELVACSLDTRTSSTGHEEVLKMEKRKSIVRKYFDKNNLRGGVFIVARYSWGMIHHDRGSHGGTGGLHASWSWQYQTTSEPELLRNWEFFASRSRSKWGSRSPQTRSRGPHLTCGSLLKPHFWSFHRRRHGLGTKRSWVCESHFTYKP